MSFVEVLAPAAPPAPAGVPSPRTVAARVDDQPVAARSRLGVAVGHVVLAALAVLSVFPVYWMYATTLRRPQDALAQRVVPWPISLANLTYVWHAIPIGRMLATTFAMATVLAAAQLLVAVLAAYGFAIWDFPGKRLLFVAFIGSWLVPFQVTMIPNYLLVSRLGLLGTVPGVVVPQLCSAFAVLLMRQHMAAFPRDLVDAAHLDGRSSWGTLWTVVLPNLRPALAAVTIMLFISAWNEYLWPALVMQSSNALIQIGIRSFLGAEGDNWGAVMAAAGLACLPVFAIYVALQRYVVDAFVRSGLK